MDEFRLLFGCSPSLLSLSPFRPGPVFLACNTVSLSLFGAIREPRESHTFLTVYRGDDLAEGRVVPATISWFPTTGVVHLIGVEPGRNVSLRQTLAIACQGRKHVATWGPYEIPSALYQRVLARIRLLESGRIDYSALSLRPGSLNCIEAAGDITRYNGIRHHRFRF